MNLENIKVVKGTLQSYNAHTNFYYDKVLIFNKTKNELFDVEFPQPHFNSFEDYYELDEDEVIIEYRHNTDPYQYSYSKKDLIAKVHRYFNRY